MNRQISAPYGLNLQQAAEGAIATYTREKAVAMTCKFRVVYSFDYHGIEILIDDATTADSLVAEITRQHKFRADWYDTRPDVPNTHTQEQHGKPGESLYDAVPSSVQCAQRWGNRWLDNDDGACVEHVFEFNGFKVAFNPWKVGEGARIQHEIEVQLAKAGQPA